MYTSLSCLSNHLTSQNLYYTCISSFLPPNYHNLHLHCIHFRSIATYITINLHQHFRSIAIFTTTYTNISDLIFAIFTTTYTNISDLLPSLPQLTPTFQIYCHLYHNLHQHFIYISMLLIH